MCEITGVDMMGSVSTRRTFFPSVLLPSRLGPSSTTSPASTSGLRYEFLWLASLPSTLAPLPFPLSLLPDLPSRLLPPGSLCFSFLNGFEKDFRKSISVVGRCRSCWGWRADGLVVLNQDWSVSSAQKMLWTMHLLQSDCHTLLFVGSHPLCITTDLNRIDICFCLSIPSINYLSIATPDAKYFNWTPHWPHRPLMLSSTRTAGTSQNLMPTEY